MREKGRRNDAGELLPRPIIVKFDSVAARDELMKFGVFISEKSLGIITVKEDLSKTRKAH